MVLVAIALVRVVHVSRLITVVLVTVTLMGTVGMLVRVVFVAVTLMSVVYVSGLVAVVLVTVTLMGVVSVCHNNYLLSFFFSLPTPGLSGSPAEVMRDKISHMSQ